MKTQNKGFTLIEFLIVLSVLAVLAAIVVPVFFGITGKAKASADIASVEQLNRATSVYSTSNNGEIFTNASTDFERMQALIDAGYFDGAVEPQQDGASFRWAQSEQTWQLNMEAIPAGN